MGEQRHMLGVRFGWLKDRVCRRRGHVPDQHNQVRVPGVGSYPICTRCGKACR